MQENEIKISKKSLETELNKEDTNIKGKLNLKGMVSKP